MKERRREAARRLNSGQFAIYRVLVDHQADDLEELHVSIEWKSPRAPDIYDVLGLDSVFEITQTPGPKTRNQLISLLNERQDRIVSDIADHEIECRRELMLLILATSKDTAEVAFKYSDSRSRDNYNDEAGMTVLNNPSTFFISQGACALVPYPDVLKSRNNSGRYVVKAWTGITFCADALEIAEELLPYVLGTTRRSLAAVYLAGIGNRFVCGNCWDTTTPMNWEALVCLILWSESMLPDEER